MDWKELYNSRRMSAKEAVSHIHSNDHVVIGLGMGAPYYVIDAMIENKDQYENVEITNMLPQASVGYTEPGMEKHFHYSTLFASGPVRKACDAGRSDVIPVYFSKIPDLIATSFKPDVAMIMVSPPDASGYCSCGISVDYTRDAALNAKTVIAQVNRHMPRTLGDSFVHVKDIDCVVEQDVPLPELAAPHLSDVELAIGRNCASLIHDGDTLQLGIGAIPDAVLVSLKDKNDLGIHTEMFADGVVELMEQGNINNRRKTLHKGKTIASFLMGGKHLYEFVNDNPGVEMYPVNYVNDPVVIAKNDNMVSVNSSVQVDIVGQAVSTSAGFRQISGIGGQVDFMRGANMSKNGRAIIAMPSTAAGGKISKIVGVIDEGSLVTTPQCDTMFVITEYGIADLRYKSLRDRARALIGVAHPDFRDQLAEAFEKRFHSKL